MSRGATRFARTRGIIPHSRPCLGTEELAAADRVLTSGRLAPGAEAARLEGYMARLTDAADALAVSSGTMALTLALRALGLGPGDEVAIPSYSCAALLHAVHAAGARPLLADIDPRTLALDPDDLARRHAPRLCAIVLVHPFGLPARLEPFRARGLLVIEDCAQAIGAVDRDRPIGSRGEAAVFSFAPTKVITCGGPGGALTSPQAALIHRARDLAIHDEREDVRPRVNGLMGDLHAAIAGVQVGRLREFRARRDVIATRYDEAFRSSGLERVTALPSTRSIVYRYIVRTPDAGALISRLEGRGITARRPVFSPLHKMAEASGEFPGTEQAHRELVSLPIYPALGDEEVETIIDEVHGCLP